ncbi:uncharacterized protein LOC131843814 [Achroia grisella]|uniref:uncharacterized protein LOC131843814 n=1 Tax=Achroia grisella TaxID=688607 RepID=UPI0027D211E1|nr:uncharacterized protein LOC131843814 [Achroia grisella]
MKLNLHNFLLLVLISASQTSIYSNLKGNLQSFVQGILENKDAASNAILRNKLGEKIDGKIARQKAKIVTRAKEIEVDLNGIGISEARPSASKERHHMDPVLNYMKRRHGSLRRTKSTSLSESSSLEQKNWKDEWKEHWIQKKLEAINATPIRGDNVNMLGARPWGVPCGDPNQHDMPWGTCMLPMECEAEYRIYRGDYFCGRTQFVCCSLQLTTYDMYQGFDVSFADSSLATDSEEKKYRDRGSKEKKRSKTLRERKKRRRQRLKRKRNIKRNIKKITKEIRKILNRSYRNRTLAGKRKTKQLKAFVENLKKQYKNDRKSVKDIHELDLMKLDAALQTKLDQIRTMNQDFINNSTFRDIIVSGKMTKEGARMLASAYPELTSYLKTRRSGTPPLDYMDYDVEYGMIYY